MGTTRAVAEAKTDGGPPICDKALRARPVHISGIDDERAHEPPHRVSDVVAPDHPFDALDAYICPSKALRVGRFSSVANARSYSAHRHEEATSAPRVACPDSHRCRSSVSNERIERHERGPASGSRPCAYGTLTWLGVKLRCNGHPFEGDLYRPKGSGRGTRCAQRSCCSR